MHKHIHGAKTAEPIQPIFTSLIDSVKPTNMEDVKVRGLESIALLLEYKLPGGKMVGREYVVLNPTRPDSNEGSFSINLDTGLWSDFATGDGGDLIDLVKYLLRFLRNDNEINAYDAARELDKWLAKIECMPDFAEHKARAVARREVDAAQQAEWTPVFPVPADSPKPFMKMKGVMPTKVSPYVDSAGQLLGYICRYDINEKKEFRPLTYCQSAEGAFQWRSLGFPVPRPLYGLDRLAANPDAAVIFVEGEKSADAAQILFPDHVAVTTMNGSQSPQKTDFSPLVGRKQVLIWPDNDAAGKGYAEKIVNQRAIISSNQRPRVFS